jgi:hypothetical protein
MSADMARVFQTQSTDVRATLHAALTYAVKEDELISRNVTTMVRLPAGRIPQDQSVVGH